MQAITLDGKALGSHRKGYGLILTTTNKALWTLCEDPRKKKEKLVLWRCVTAAHISSVGCLKLVPENVDPNDESLQYSWERVSLSELLAGEE